MFSSILETLNVALKIYDKHLSTKYQKKFYEIYEEIQKEESKPIADSNLKPTQLRDQNKLDHLYYELKLFLELFNKENDK